MLNKELQKLLQQFPEDLEVCMADMQEVVKVVKVSTYGEDIIVITDEFGE